MNFRRVLELGLAAVAAGCVALVLITRQETAQVREELEQVRRSAAETKQALEALRLERDQLIAALEAEKPEEAEAIKAKGAGSESAAGRLEYIRLLSETEEKLRQAQATIQELQIRLEDFDARVRGAGEETESLRRKAEELTERLDTSNRLILALQTEMKSRNTRLAQLELQNKELRKKNDDLERRQERIDKAREELDEIQRRREMYLANILRRYREVTDVYRGLALRLDNPRDVASAGAPLTTDIARIQNAITLADEDLRQIRALNEREERLYKRVDTR